MVHGRGANPPAARAGTLTPVSLKARGLRKAYGEFEAVKGIDFEVYRGECFGFLGPNGAGKTTTMKMIYGVVIPGGGELSVVGRDVRRDIREIKRRIGVVPQENNLDEELTVRENLLVYGRYFDLPRKLIRRRVEELLEFVQLSEKSGERVEHLSGGMKRRLLIARALVNAPELVVLDEPTTGLDPQARHLVWEKLRQLRNGGTTLILTTHYMDEAAQLCDRLVIMDNGNIIREGAPQRLIEENTSPEVLEFRPRPDRLEDLQRLLETEAEHVERSADLLLAYTHDSDALMQAVRRSGIEIENTLYRRASLEDVFLRLTGRRLIE
ncbi:ATP-binding cassette domain-containing protein [Rubrobacter taiwanensis]|jgi:lipooligosaccharide transport system ATP-binding protein|uniref:ATP-binding cassette domain-containing protein n=1 Tax=Rubrobacter taiwanensis TaxID=185139 RepID=A0A4V2NWI1_9ACTN|nr:ATP-binding cassette domain-containing protein [Rubrobacter taiwanensis]TCJ17382.1 ATP-binding cassette domain-containing protein [Rubrobacter taiwanensis]